MTHTSALANQRRVPMPLHAQGQPGQNRFLKGNA